MEAKKLKNEEKKETKVIDFKTKKGVTVYANKEDAVKGLKKWDVANINKRLKQAYIAEKDADAKSTLLEAKNKVKLKEIENQRKEMQAEKDVLYFQYSNTSIKNKMARLNRFTDFTSTINEQTKKEIKDLEKKGKKFSRNSMACSILSALTSCFGLYAIEGGTNIMFFVSCIFMIVISTYNNHIINNIVTITSKFKKNDSVSNVLVSMMYAVCTIIISYSVYTNFQFWSAIQKSLFAAAIYSVVFDATSIVFALMSNMYKTLDFNSKYIESMKDLDIEIENSQLKNSQSEIENNKIEIEKSPVEIEKSPVEIENLKVEIENNRIEIENYKLQIEKLKTETEKSPVEIEKLKTEIEKLKTETENTIENKLKQIENAIENGNDFNSISTQSQFQLNLANRYNAELLGLLSSNLNLISVQFQLEGAKKYDVIDTEKGQVEIETRLKNTTRKIEIEKSEIENDEIIIENSQSKIEIEKSKLKNQELKLKTENKKMKSKSKKLKTETVESKAMTKVEKSIRKMILKMEDNERVKAKDIKDTFGLTSNEWADIRNNLVEDGLLYTKGSNAYKTAQKMGTI